MVGKNVKCEHSNVVINVAYSKLKLQLHFRITFLLLSQQSFRKINKWWGGGGGWNKSGGLEKFGKFIKRGGRLFGTREYTIYVAYVIFI